MLVSFVRNPLIVAPFVDPDEATYAEVVTAKEIEIRNANVVPGAGTLVELRQNNPATTTNVLTPESEAFGEQIDSCDSATGWTAGTSTAIAADTGVKNEGTASIRATITALAASGTSTNSSPAGKALKWYYGPNAVLRFDVRISSLTNVSRVSVRLRLSNGASLRYDGTPSTTGVFENKALNLGSPNAVAGTLPVAGTVATIDRIDFEIVATSGGSVTATAYLDNVRVGSPLTWESSYDVRVRYKDAAAFGPWSPWTTIKVSQPPTVAQAVAIDNTDPAPTFDWTFTSPGGKAQASYRALVTLADGSVVWDSGRVTSSATVVTMPGWLLVNGTTYFLTLTAYDTDGLAGVWAPASWTTSFSTPAGLVGSLTLTPNPDDSSVDVTWPATALSAAQFYSYEIYRQDPETGLMDLIAEVFDPAVLTITDREAPHGVSILYRVTQTNGYAESDPVQGTTTLDLDYWITHPTDPTLIFPIRHVDRFEEKFPVQRERFEPLDRPEPVVLTGQSLPPDGTVSFRRLVGEDDPVPDLRRAQTAQPYVILKSPFGDVRRVSIGDVTSGRAGAGTRSASFDYTTVEA